MLIGRIVSTAFQPLRIIYGKEDEPWAEEYKFGWTIIGRVCLDEKEVAGNQVLVSRISVQREEPKTFFNLPSSNSNANSSVVAFSTKSQSKDVTCPQQ